jgi:hypothetical protein
MPYIKKSQRDLIEKELVNLISQMQKIPDYDKGKAGILNYITTRLCCAMMGNEIKYSKINELVGALECCKMELYRRVAGKYEDEKISQNGDAYPNELV